jgi:hypothetical protein
VLVLGDEILLGFFVCAVQETVYVDQTLGGKHLGSQGLGCVKGFDWGGGWWVLGEILFEVILDVGLAGFLAVGRGSDVLGFFQRGLLGSLRIRTV